MYSCAEAWRIKLICIHCHERGRKREKGLVDGFYYEAYNTYRHLSLSNFRVEETPQWADQRERESQNRSTQLKRNNLPCIFKSDMPRSNDTPFLSAPFLFLPFSFLYLSHHHVRTNATRFDKKEKERRTQYQQYGFLE